MKKVTRFQVYHTTETGADYVVKGFDSREAAVEFEFANRDNFPRPLIIRKDTFKY